MNCKNCNNKLPSDAKFCNKCGKPVALRESSTIEYFAISPKRLVLFSIITFGVYEIYWFYKNWEAVKKFEGEKIYPFWRAIFAVFFCYSLFKKVLESAKSNAYEDSYSPGWLATVYILLLIIGNGLSRIESYDIGFNLIWLTVAIATFIPLLSIQRAINFNNGRVRADFKLRKEFSGGEVVLIVVGVIWSLLVLVGIFIP